MYKPLSQSILLYMSIGIVIVLPRVLQQTALIESIDPNDCICKLLIDKSGFSIPHMKDPLCPLLCAKC